MFLHRALKLCLLFLSSFLISGSGIGGEMYSHCENLHLKKNLEIHGDCYADNGQLRWGVWIDLRFYIENYDGFLSWSASGGFDRTCSEIRLTRDYYLIARCEAFRNGRWTKIRTEIDLATGIKVQDGWLVYDDLIPPTGPTCTDPEYVFDETRSYPPHSCKTSCDCNSTRTCSGAGYCQDSHRPPVIVYPETEPEEPEPGPSSPSPIGVPRGSSGSEVTSEETVDRIEGLVMEDLAHSPCKPGINITVSKSGDDFWAKVEDRIFVNDAQRNNKACFFTIEKRYDQKFQLFEQQDPNDPNCTIFRGFKSSREILRLRNRRQGGARCFVRDESFRHVFFASHTYNGRPSTTIPSLPRLPRDVNDPNIYKIADQNYYEIDESREGIGYLGDYNQRLIVSFVEFMDKKKLRLFERFMGEKNWHHQPTLIGYQRKYGQWTEINGERVEKPYMYITNMAISFRDYIRFFQEG